MTKNELKKKISRELMSLIDNNASVVEISHWADQIYSDHCRDLDPQIDELITKISFMQHGTEFEIDKPTLKNMVKQFLENLNND